ncbi:Relaxase/Mobilisation nuclease domain-containing protein [Epilithonimonas bovis DSM 19482]|uniref:Relaxase/Mobilisation nuclease domain-containing protein n=1 Tax=Epilithonimonas bovis DSM 19482 TaxID=1121284 RepID=A0A1U7PY29_9FLAO|nr:relaxase/mobilization nuclease domain-containing protein [Epilithonimonas bovis]SIT96862.1 Relaxase/Mobilisation nuclease domain-containing protein [Epilithonimonas bovis DSM 19482]
MAPAGSNFPGVKYNEKKIENGKGELMLMKNFPSYINSLSSQDEVKKYLASVSKDTRTKKPQFHATISTRFQDHTKEQLKEIAEDFMKNMGYGEQPFIVVFHNDTENNHVHIVTTRVDKKTGNKIEHDFERLKAQKALSLTMEKLYSENSKSKIEKLLKYNFQTLNQLKLLLQRDGFTMSENNADSNKIDVLKNGVVEKTLQALNFSNAKNANRLNQIKAIMQKYKGQWSNQVFKVVDRRAIEGMLPNEKISDNSNLIPNIEYESELQEKLRKKFGIDIIFHFKDDRSPFGYSLIDHKTGSVYKGSEVLKMNDLFDITDKQIDKRLFERIKDFTFSNTQSKDIIQSHFQKKFGVQSFMIYSNNIRKSKETFMAIKDDLRNKINGKTQSDVILNKVDGVYYFLHQSLHYSGKIEDMISEKEMVDFLQKIEGKNSTNILSDILNSGNSIISEFLKSSGGSSKDPGEDELKRKRKKRR